MDLIRTGSPLTTCEILAIRFPLALLISFRFRTEVYLTKTERLRHIKHLLAFHLIFDPSLFRLSRLDVAPGQCGFGTPLAPATASGIRLCRAAPPLSALHCTYSTQCTRARDRTADSEHSHAHRLHRGYISTRRARFRVPRFTQHGPLIRFAAPHCGRVTYCQAAGASPLPNSMVQALLENVHAAAHPASAVQKPSQSFFAQLSKPPPSATPRACSARRTARSDLPSRSRSPVSSPARAQRSCHSGLRCFVKHHSRSCMWMRMRSRGAGSAADPSASGMQSSLEGTCDHRIGSSAVAWPTSSPCSSVSFTTRRVHACGMHRERRPTS